jgi:hypothetical protein
LFEKYISHSDRDKLFFEPARARKYLRKNDYTSEIASLLSVTRNNDFIVISTKGRPAMQASRACFRISDLQARMTLIFWYTKSVGKLTKENIDKLLLCGIIAGPLFLVSSFVHGLLREGFDLVRHPASLLSLGELGWIQIATFVISGLLYIASAFGLREVLKTGIGSRFVFPLFLMLGLALIGGGVFTADPSLGFPPGAIKGVPATMSWHSQVHGLAPIVGFMALVIAQIILGRRFGKEGQKGLMWLTIGVAISTWIMSAAPSFLADWERGEFNFIPLWLGVALGYTYTSYVLYKLRK